MNFKELCRQIEKLEVGQSCEIYRCDDGVEVFLLRPTPKQVGKRLVNIYDEKTNFQIWLREDHEFRPNHLRLFIDLDLKVRSRSDFQIPLLKLFERIYQGEDPLDIYREVENEDFRMQLNSLECNLCLAQLFLAEQNISYSGESKFDPKCLFFQGYMRQAILQIVDIDKLLWNATKNNPPSVWITCKDNKKHKKYDENVEDLWFLNEENYSKVKGERSQKKL